MEAKRGPGRPATGKTPTRCVRIGDVWDRAKVLAEQQGETITEVIERKLVEYLSEPRA